MNDRANIKEKQKNTIEIADNNKPIEKNVSSTGGIVFPKDRYMTINKNIDDQNNGE